MEENQSKFKKYLYNQIALVTAIIGVVWGVYNYINLPTVQFKLDIQQLQNDVRINNEKITNLKDNDIHTLTLNVDKILENQMQIQKDIVKLQVMTEENYRKFYPTQND